MSDELKDIYKRIDAYVKGSLTEDEINDLWVEFAKNPALLEHLELEVGVKEVLKSSIKTESARKAKIISLPNWTWHAAAAAVLLLVASIQLLKIPSKSNLDQFVVTSINGDQLETADGIRSKQMQISKADSILNLGFNEFVSGSTTRALALFNEVIDDFDYKPYGSKAYLNKGIVFYNESRYDSAIVAFNSALSRVDNSKMIEEKGYWFLGNALVNTGEVEQARDAILQAYALDGVFRKQAFLLLQKLNYDLGYSEAESAGD